MANIAYTRVLSPIDLLYFRLYFYLIELISWVFYQSTSYSNSKKKAHTPRDSSQDAFKEKKKKHSYNTDIEKTFRALERRGKATRRMLAADIGVLPSNVSQYAKALLQENRIEELPNKEPCGITNVKSYWLVISKPDNQTL